MNSKGRLIRRRCVITAGAVAAISAIPANATVWDGGTGTTFNWSTATNWDTNVEPTSSDAVFFPTPVPFNISTISLNSGEVAQGIIFQDSYFLSGGDLTFGAGGGFITTVGATSCSIGSALKGSVGITKGGPGNLTLTGSNSFTGTASVAYGDLIINSNAALGSAANPVSVSGSSLASTLDISSATIDRSITLNSLGTIRGIGVAASTGTTTIAPSASVTLASGTSVTDILTMGNPFKPITGGAGSTIHIAGAGVVSLPYNNSAYTGDWQVDSGTLRVGTSSATSGGTTPIPVATGAVLEIADVNWGRDLILNNGSTLRGTGSAFYSRTATIAPSASVTFATTNSSDTLSNSVVGSNITGGNGATIHIVGPGTVQLFQPSSFLGNWQVDSGTLFIGSGASELGSGSTPVVVNNSGVIQFPGGGNMTRDITLNSGATVRSPQNYEVSSTIQCNAGAEVFDVGSGSTLEMSGVISAGNSSSVSKTGSGTLLTTNQNSFLGTLDVDNGVIRQTGGANSIPNNTFTIGSASGSTGNYELVDGSLTTTEERIGVAGDGGFVQSGGTHTISGSLNPLWIAAGIGSHASYSLSGGVLNVVNDVTGANGEAVGFNGVAMFKQTGGTHTVSGTNGNLVIGYAATGVGTYTISGGLLQSNSLYLGRDAGSAGTLNVNGGSVSVLTDFLDIGLNASSSGTVNASAGDITAPGIYVGGVSTQPRGAGVLTVNGGNVTAANELRVWDTTGSAINLESGTLTCATLSTSSNISRFNWTGGTLRITGPNGFNVSSTGPLGANPSVGSASTLDVTNDIAIGTSSTLTVAGRATARSIHASGPLNITGAGKVIIPANGTSTGISYLQTLSLGQDATLDLNDNDLVVNNGVFSTIQNLVFQGYRQGASPGTTGIISTTGQTAAGNPILAVLNNALVDSPDYPFGSGHTISANAIIGKYTYFGDTNLDGQVTADDYGALDANFGATGVDPGVAWIVGDTNFDGSVTSDDYGTLDANFGFGVGNPLSAQGTVAVPEPVGTMLALVALGAMRRRRRRRG